MKVVTSVPAMQRLASAWHRQGRRIGLVPTMGYLHEGHLALVRLARLRSDYVVTSIFVNPIQFSPNEDLARYPRDFTRDQALLAQEGVEVIYCPDAAEMYPADFSTYVNVERLSEPLCGKSRPGHFRGVTTVVAKLFNAVKPHLAVFGAKDAQQALLVRRMARNLDYDLEVVVLPTVREPDGLAMSSRNSYLSPSDRREAPVLYRALQQAEKLIAQGERDPKKVVEAISRLIMRGSAARVEYVSIVDADNLGEVPEIRGEVLIALAAFFGKTRLIDNILVQAPPCSQ